jgi:hypothetical protein
MPSNASKVELQSLREVLDNGGKSNSEDNTTSQELDSETEKTAVERDLLNQRFLLTERNVDNFQPRPQPTSGMMSDAESEVLQLDSLLLPTTIYKSVEHNSTSEDGEELLEEPPEDHQEQCMVSDYQVLHKLLHMATIDSQLPMHLIEVAANLLTLTKERVCGGKPVSEVTIKLLSSRLETEQTAVEIGLEMSTSAFRTNFQLLAARCFLVAPSLAILLDLALMGNT